MIKERQILRKLNKDGFTLTEVLIYIGVLATIVAVISSFSIWSVHSNTKIKTMREVSDNANRAMEIITHEIKEAKSIYTPTTTSSQLSLETTHYLPQGEESTYIDFYLCGTRLCLKKESQDPIALTAERVEVKSLKFTQVSTNSNFSSIQIDLQIDYKNPSNKDEYQASINLTNTASLRSY